LPYTASEFDFARYLAVTYRALRLFFDNFVFCSVGSSRDRKPKIPQKKFSGASCAQAFLRKHFHAGSSEHFYASCGSETILILF
jgi:hypothetical protein